MDLASKEKRSILFSAGILAGTMLFSNILGLIRDRMLVATFPTDVLDTYVAAFKIPDLIYNIFILGALSSAFLPVYSTFIAKKEKKEANDLANAVINIGFIFVCLISIVLFLLTPKIMPFFVAGFDQERIQTTVELTRLMLLAPIFLGISGVFTAILNAHKNFFVASLSPLFYNLGIILGIKLLGENIGIYGAGIGVLAGAFLHMAIQIPAVFKAGFLPNFRFDFKNNSAKKVLKLMIPRSFGLVGVQITNVVNVFIASGLRPGSITVFNLANNIQTLPMVVFGLAYSQAIFPHISHNAALKENKEFVNKINWGVRQILFWIIPATIGIIILRAQIVRLALGVGFFNFIDTRLTAGVLAAFVLSLFAQSLIPLFARAFYALRETKTPVLIGIFSGAVNVMLAFVLSHPYFINFYGEIFRVPIDGRVVGLGLAFSIASIINLLLLISFLKKRVSGILSLREISDSLLKIIIASSLMGYFVWKLKNIAAFLVEPTHPTSGLLLQLILGLVVGGIIYFGLAYLFKMEELKSVKVILNRFKKA